jgi:hypothetical protein
MFDWVVEPFYTCVQVREHSEITSNIIFASTRTSVSRLVKSDYSLKCKGQSEVQAKLSNSDHQAPPSDSSGTFFAPLALMHDML